jgi:hypothetical protein
MSCLCVMFIVVLAYDAYLKFATLLWYVHMTYSCTLSEDWNRLMCCVVFIDKYLRTLWRIVKPSSSEKGIPIPFTLFSTPWHRKLNHYNPKSVSCCSPIHNQYTYLKTFILSRNKARKSNILYVYVTKHQDWAEGKSSKAFPLQAWTDSEGSRRLSFSERIDCFYTQEIFLVTICVIGWVDPRAIMRPEVWSQRKISVTPLVIEPASFWLLAQSLNQLRHIVPGNSVNALVDGH